MQASKLYPGEYYAFHSYPPKGSTPIDAVKVRLLEIVQRKDFLANNRSTFAKVRFVETEKEKEVRARQLIDFWDNYEIEQAHMLKERDERQRKARRENLRREITQALINLRLLDRHVPVVIKVNYSAHSCTIDDIGQVFDWLGITHDQIEEALDKAMEEKSS